jgi:hypothetical protein
VTWQKQNALIPIQGRGRRFAYDAARGTTLVAATFYEAASQSDAVHPQDAVIRALVTGNGPGGNYWSRIIL